MVVIQWFLIFALLCNQQDLYKNNRLQDRRFQAVCVDLRTIVDRINQCAHAINKIGEFQIKVDKLLQDDYDDADWWKTGD